MTSIAKTLGPRTRNSTLVATRHRSVTSTSCEGFTLLEIMIAMAILTIVLAGWMFLVVQSFKMVKDTDDRIAALNEAGTVLNLIRSANDNSATFPTNVLTAFPPGILAPARTTVPSEVVTIEYQDDLGNAVTLVNLAAPVYITVTVQYVGADGRNHTEALSTIIADI